LQGTITLNSRGNVGDIGVSLKSDHTFPADLVVIFDSSIVQISFKIHVMVLTWG